MDAATLAVEARVEATHWWFVGRRLLLESVIRQLALAADAAVLDVGSGTGTNLRLLRSLGCSNVAAVDAHEAAIHHCAAKGFGPVTPGDLHALPFADGRFALVLATDVLEHVDDDRRALSEVARVLAPGGRVVITVPAFPSLWGLQDEVSHHRRRYRRGPLLRAAADAGLVVSECTYFNYVLFLPIWAARQIIRLLRLRLASENEVNAPLLNGLLTAVFAADVRSARWIRPPFGVSLLVVGHKPSGAASCT